MPRVVRGRHAHGLAKGTLEVLARHAHAARERGRIDAAGILPGEQRADLRHARIGRRRLQRHTLGTDLGAQDALDQAGDARAVRCRGGGSQGLDQCGIGQHLAPQGTARIRRPTQPRRDPAMRHVEHHHAEAAPAHARGVQHVGRHQHQLARVGHERLAVARELAVALEDGAHAPFGMPVRREAGARLGREQRLHAQALARGQHDQAGGRRRRGDGGHRARVAQQRPRHDRRGHRRRPRRRRHRAP